MNFYKNKQLDNYRECDCECHVIGAIHIVACCDGQCPGCKKHFHKLDNHTISCREFFEWCKKQKKGLLQSENWLDNFNSAKEYWNTVKDLDSIIANTIRGGQTL